MQSKRERGAWVWPAIIVVMLACHAVGTMVAVMWTKVDAHSGGAVVPHSYNKVQTQAE